MSEDAEFEAFLKGEDELSRRLQALPQPSPSAELDAVIMKRVKFSVAQQGRPAANDPGQDGAVPQLARGLGWRWRVPAGIAATLLVGVFANQAFDNSNRQRELPQEATPALIIMEQPAEAPPPAMIPPPPPPADMVVAQARPVAEPAPAMAAPAPAPAPKMAEQPPEPESVVEVRSEKPRPAPILESASPVTIIASPDLPPPKAAAAPAPAPAMGVGAAREAKRAAADQANYAAEDKVTVTGSRIRAAGPEEHLGRIEAMLKAGQNADALAAWDKFRAAYPDHVVPAALEAKIKALPR